MSIKAIYAGRGDSIVGSSAKEVTSVKVFAGHEALPTRDGTVTNLGAVAIATVYTSGTGASKRLIADTGTFASVSAGDWIEVDNVGPRKVIAKLSSTEIEVDTDVAQILQASAEDVFVYSRTLTGVGTDFTVLEVGDYVQVGDYDSLEICEVIKVTSATSIDVRFGADDVDEDYDRKILASTASTWRIFDLTFLGDCAKVSVNQKPTEKHLSGMLGGPKAATYISNDETTVVFDALETSLQRMKKINRSVALYRDANGVIVGARGASMQGMSSKDTIPLLIVEVINGEESTDKLRWLRLFKCFFAPDVLLEFDGDTQRKLTVNGTVYKDKTKLDPNGRPCFWETGEIPA